MAWTITTTYDGSHDWNNSQRIHCFKLACTSDASSSGDQTLSTLLLAAYPETTHPNKYSFLMQECVRGSLGYAVKYDPDGTDTPTSDPTVTIDDETAGVVFSKAFTAATPLNEPFANTTGQSPIIRDLVLASTTLANTKKAVFYIYLIK